MDPEYQEQHLQFVATHNNGSSITDIILAGSSCLLPRLLFWASDTKEARIFILVQHEIICIINTSKKN
jgi:hypothetical protein